MARLHEVLPDRALDALDHLAGIGGDDRRVFGIAFVGAAPAVVLHHRDGRREAPVDAGRRGLCGGDRADLLDQRWIAHRAKADVMREQRRADDIVGAVDRVGAPDHRHHRTTVRALDRGVVEGVEQLEPFRRGGEFVAVGRRIAAVEDRAELVRLEILGRDAGDVDLDELADLVLDAHLGEDRGDARLDLGVALQLHWQHRPLLGMRGGGGGNGRARCLLLRQCGRRAHHQRERCASRTEPQNHHPLPGSHLRGDDAAKQCRHPVVNNTYFNLAFSTWCASCRRNNGVRQGAAQGGR